VLGHYVAVGVEELALDKLTPLLRLRFHDSMADATRALGPADKIREAFAGFQRFLYEG
jgi:type I restriction enzyme R subunit